MAIKYVEPVYKVSEKPRTLWEGGVPSGVERALGAVILFTVTQDKDGWGNLEEYKYLSAVFNPGRAGRRETARTTQRVRLLGTPQRGGRSRGALRNPGGRAYKGWYSSRRNQGKPGH